MTDSRITLESLKEQFALDIEPYVLATGPQKLDLFYYGEAVCGSDHLFREWLEYEFGIQNCAIPRDMVEPLKTYLQSLEPAALKTISEWVALGRKRYANFDAYGLPLVYFATRKRTKFAPLMTEEEVTRMIYAWRNNPAPTPATQQPPEPFIHAPMVLCLPDPSVQVVPLLPAITDTPLVYGCDQFIQVPVEVDAAPAFAGQDNRTQWLAVRVVEVEDDEIEIVFEPDEELNALIQEPVKIPSRLEHVIEMEKKLHATRKARILEIENEVCQFFELERFAFRTTTGKFTSTVIDQQDAETLRGYLVHLESKYDSMKSRQALGDRRESRRLGKTG